MSSKIKAIKRSLRVTNSSMDDENSRKRANSSTSAEEEEVIGGEDEKDSFTHLTNLNVDGEQSEEESVDDEPKVVSANLNSEPQKVGMINTKDSVYITHLNCVLIELGKLHKQASQNAANPFYDGTQMFSE